MLLKIFTPSYSRKSWSKSCEHKIWGLIAFIITLMGCREAIFVDKSTIDFPIFLLFFNTNVSFYFPIFSILSFLFSYFLSNYATAWTPCRWLSDARLASCLNSLQKSQAEETDEQKCFKFPEVKKTCYKLYCFKTALDSDKLLLHTWF